MRLRKLSLTLACMTCGSIALAQDGAWVTAPDVESADLAVRGWKLVAASGHRVTDEMNLSATFWESADGEIARCLFSLVTPTGTGTFETCAIATVQPE